MEEIVKKIKEKKPLDNLDDDYVLGFIDEFFKKEPKLKKKYENQSLKKIDVKKIVKNVRNDLNRFYGQFWLSDSIRESSHRSVRERNLFYEKFYYEIFFRIGIDFKSILDLGCGLNPLTYNLIPNYKDTYFIAVELTKKDCDKIVKIFKKDEIDGEVIKADLRRYNDFPKVDICFMFKLLESLEGEGHKLAEHLITNLKASYIIVSFSTLDTKGRRMNYPRRGWFERMLSRLGLRFDKFEDFNEIFYIIEKAL
ncbi:hypothetical protein J4216_01065 [Candidatus Woesearchaeota archaeon]|nr:hypothetical protein [Candidatus Woesearchaeota archaeon]